MAVPESLAPALDGADALFLLTSGEFMAAGGSVDDVLGAARAGGVRRVVLLSSQGVATGSHPSTMEDAVTRSDLEWTLLRPGGFDSNTLQWAEMIRTRRTVAAPFGDVALPTIDPAERAARTRFSVFRPIVSPPVVLPSTALPLFVIDAREPHEPHEVNRGH